MWEAAIIVPVKHQTYGQEAAVVPQGTHLDLPVWAAGIPTRHGIRFCGAIRARFDFANPVLGKNNSQRLLLEWMHPLHLVEMPHRNMPVLRHMPHALLAGE